jgi:hypothetical protein
MKREERMDMVYYEDLVGVLIGKHLQDVVGVDGSWLSLTSIYFLKQMVITILGRCRHEAQYQAKVSFSLDL